MNDIGDYVAGGGVSGVVFGIFFLLYKYCNNHRVNCISGCCKVQMEEDRTPPRIKPLEEVNVESQNK